MDLFFDDEFSTNQDVFGHSEPTDCHDPWLVMQRLQLCYQESTGDPTAQANYHAQIKALKHRHGLA